MKRNGQRAQAERVLKMLRQLRGQRGGVSLAELAEHYGTTKKAIYRDIAVFQRAGYDVDTEVVNRRTIVHLESTLDKGALADGECFTFVILRRILEMYRQTPIYHPLCQRG